MLNLSQEVRKYMYTNFMSMENQMKEFIKTKNGYDETTFMNNASNYFDVLSDKKHFLRTMIRAR